MAVTTGFTFYSLVILLLTPLSMAARPLTPYQRSKFPTMFSCSHSRNICRMWTMIVYFGSSSWPKSAWLSVRSQIVYAYYHAQSGRFFCLFFFSTWWFSEIGFSFLMTLLLPPWKMMHCHSRGTSIPTLSLPNSLPWLPLLPCIFPPIVYNWLFHDQ